MERKSQKQLCKKNPGPNLDWTFKFANVTFNYAEKRLAVEREKATADH